MNSTSCVNVSRQTVSRRLQEIGLFNRTPRKEPLVSSKNKKKRLEFANRYVIWTYENWAKVFFRDESKFDLFGNDGKNHVKRRIGERLSAKCTKKTVKFGGGSVMVFGMFSSQGTTPLVRLQTRVKTQRSIKTLFKIMLCQSYRIQVSIGLPLCKIMPHVTRQRW